MRLLFLASFNADMQFFRHFIFSCMFIIAVWPAPLESRRAKNAPNAETNSTLHYLERTFRALDRTLEFFWREKEQVNLDTIIGTRIVEATMNVLLERFHFPSKQSVKLPSMVWQHIVAIRDHARDVSNATIPFIIRNQPHYYSKIGTILLPGIFQLNYASRDVSGSVHIWPYNPDEAMNEDESDDCLAEVFGTRSGYRCQITSECWKKMTRNGYNEYSLSHEIFYLEISEGLGCQAEMMFHVFQSSQPGLHGLHERFCANMLMEADRIATKGFPPEMRDLFMEQAALCGILGYRQFFSSDWLEHILSWQDEVDGCYKWDGWLDYNTDEIYKTEGQRVKREEKRVSRGCLCHRTTVAASALAQYVRYIIEYGVDEGHVTS